MFRFRARFGGKYHREYGCMNTALETGGNKDVAPWLWCWIRLGWITSEPLATLGEVPVLLLAFPGRFDIIMARGQLCLLGALAFFCSIFAPELP